jgi:glycosyltransferase involved in cell wall biosynthesis
MSLSPEQITIAVTVFSRRQYLTQAIRSALDQTRPVRVMVVEDCGPDPGLESFVRAEFGSRVDYLRNPQRRGLFGNWNACLDYCGTPWLSILHDDDFLAPCFVEAMLELHRLAPDCGLLFGQTQIVTHDGQPTSRFMRPPLPLPWRRVNLAETLITTPFPFPGHLFRVDQVRALGSFRESSQYCGDWEMWSKLIARHGAAQTQAMVAYNRQHVGTDRGTTTIMRSGRHRPLVFVQQKRVLALLRQEGNNLRFERSEFLTQAPMSVDYLLECGVHFSPRLLRYNTKLVLCSRPPSPQYAVFRVAARLLGPGFVRRASRLYRWFARPAT